MKKLLVTIILLLIPITIDNSSYSDDTYMKEIVEFQFNKTIAIKYAIAALEEFDEVIYKEKRLNKEFNLKSPFTSSIYSKTSDGKKHKVIIVCFPHKSKKNDFAVVHLILNKDGYMELWSRQYTIRKIEELLYEIQNPEESDFWGEGI